MKDSPEPSGAQVEETRVDMPGSLGLRATVLTITQRNGVSFKKCQLSLLLFIPKFSIEKYSRPLYSTQTFLVYRASQKPHFKFTVRLDAAIVVDIKILNDFSV